MKKINKTKMDYDFLNNYLVNHCEELTEMTEENKKYFKRVKCFYGNWTITYEKVEGEKVYIDKIDPSVYYRINHDLGQERTKETKKVIDKTWIYIYKEEYQLIKYPNIKNYHEDILRGYKTTEKGSKYMSPNDRELCEELFNKIYTYLEYKKLNDKLKIKEETKKKIIKI